MSLETKQRLIVVGNGMVGHKYIETLIEHPDYQNYQITTFSEEPRLAYDRVQLSAYFSGSTVEDLMMTSEDYYDEHDVQYIIKDKVVDINRTEKS